MEGLDSQLADVDEGRDVVAFGEADHLGGVANVGSLKLHLGIGVPVEGYVSCDIYHS